MQYTRSHSYIHTIATYTPDGSEDECEEESNAEPVAKRTRVVESSEESSSEQEPSEEEEMADSSSPPIDDSDNDEE
jgi:hypothetical protein